MIRRDVNHLAENLNIKSGLSTTSIYAFLVAVGKAKRINPCRISWTVGDGVVFPAGERDTCCLRRCTISGPHTYDDGASDYWHDRIMTRQDLDAE